MTPAATADRFETVLERDASEIARHADRVLGSDGDRLSEAMLYALQGGKMLRGFLVREGARLHGADEQAALDAALAIECVHAYSLVHDDLPCMDDDDLRRGRPTLHRARDEATAVLAGDALQALAFELLTGDAVGRAGHALARSLAEAAGRRGMVAGQMMDIAAETAETPLDLGQIETLQDRKTGALLIWAAAAGPRLSGDDPAALTAYGRALGLAFQIADDILDVEGDAQDLGKAVGKDAGRGKATFVSHLGLDGAKRRAEQMVTRACDSLSAYGARAETLRQAARFVIARRT